MAGRDYLNVGQNAGAKSSSSSVDSTGNAVPKRLSTVPEKNVAAIDVEQAINLLTELKKTATPEQLVALHKALLPTRDSIISTADSSPGKRTSLIRQKSMLPPGLATRGGASEDLLKRQEEVEPVKKEKTSPRGDGHHRLQSKSSIAALDLADDAANPLPPQRTATPNEQQYFGAYRPGTLRITNGTASPEPSVRPRTSEVVAAGAASNEQTVVSRDRAGSLAKIIAESRDFSDAVGDSPKQRPQSNRETRQPQQRPSSRDPSQSRHYRSKRSQEPMKSSTPLTRSREPSLSRQPLPLETKQSRPDLAATKKASIDTLLRRSIDSISIRKSLDDGRVSPIDAPRFAQRWSHRASQISHEYMTDCDVPVSPFEDKQTALAFAQRLSTVYDREDAEYTANETPEAALSKLEGTLQEVEVPSQQSTPQRPKRQSDQNSEERRSPRTTAEGLNGAVRPPIVTYHSEPRPLPTKADSGYVSDASHQSFQRKLSHDAATTCADSPATYEHVQGGYREIMHRVDPDTDDVQSLYTLEQILKMPSLSAGPRTPTRPEAARKHSSLLRLPGLKKSSLSASRTTLDAHSSADSLPLPAEVEGSSPVDTKVVRQSKKLQKRMPEEVRKQRKALREKEKQSSLTLATQEYDAMDMPTDLSELASSPAPVSELASASTTMLPSSPLPANKESTPSEALSELIGDTRQPVELDTDESVKAPTRSLSRRQSKKSRRRSRQSTEPVTDTEVKAEPKPKRSFSLGRKRSKSKRRSGSLTPKRKSKEVPGVPSIAALSATWDEHGSQENLPLYSDYGSVARSLGTNPYDISTGMFKQGAQRPGAVLDQLQSPHQIGTTFSRTKTGGLRGMDSTMASELARMKSRDVAIQNNEDLYDRPRMATPNKRGQQSPQRPRTMMPNAVMVEGRSPGWSTKPVFQQASFESLRAESRPRPHSIAESIPSLPELPVDAEVRASKAVEYLAKRQRGLQHSPVLAESPSPSSSPDPSSAEHPGFSNESVADAVAKAVEVKRARQAERVKQGQKAERLRPAGPRMNSDTSSSSGKLSLQIHGIDERPYSHASASILIGVGSEIGEQEVRPLTAPARTEGEDEVSVWERQAQMWRERSVGKSLGNPVDEEAVTDGEQLAPSPSIVVSRHSALYSLPSAQRRRKSASEQANAYRDLIGSESEKFDESPPPLPNPNRVSTQSTTTVTTNRSSTSTVVVVENALPAKAYQQATLINRSRSPGGRVRTPSGSYHPYNPDHAAQAERSRASCLAQLEGQHGGEMLSPRSTQSLDLQRRGGNHQQSDTLESILGRYERTLSPVPASEAGSVTQEREEGKGRLDVPGSGQRGVVKGPVVMDRYSGGLQYGYQRGVGLQGSSGLRGSVQQNVSTAPRTGNQFSEQFGLDLGDVPMFLRRAG